MGEAKRIVLKPIDRKDADALIRRVHYSGKTVNNSQIHIGVFIDGRLEGAMQFGPSLDKRKVQGLVRGTLWNEFIELNRMAFSDSLPRNSESRALGVAMRMIKKFAAHLKWVISFADGAQCGDGTIYRAAGFCLTGMRRNNSAWVAPSGEPFSRTSLTDNSSKRQFASAMRIVNRTSATKGKAARQAKGGATMQPFIDAGFRPLDGFQLRYLYFLHPNEQKNLAVPIIPFSKIAEMGARMYKGKRASGVDSDTSGFHSEEGGASPTDALQIIGG